MVRLNAAHQSGVPIAPWCEWAEHTCWASAASLRERAGSEHATMCTRSAVEITSSLSALLYR
eukprot:3339421-Pleurochrysis_carterae.AAC.1